MDGCKSGMMLIEGAGRMSEQTKTQHPSHFVAGDLSGLARAPLLAGTGRTARKIALVHFDSSFFRLPAGNADDTDTTQNCVGEQSDVTHADYQTDFFAWTEQQSAILRGTADGETSSGALDHEHLAEEIEDLGISEFRALKSDLQNIALHLLKWKYQPALKGPSWAKSIANGRDSVNDRLGSSLSLRNKITDDVLVVVFRRARRDALLETELAPDRIPEGVVFTLAELESDSFYPDAEES